MNRVKNPCRIFSRHFLVLLILVVFPRSSAVAQAPHVVVTGPGDRDLKRTAHRLRISTVQLKHARQALQEAKSLSGRANPQDYWQLSQLAALWLQLDRSRAASAIESLFEQVRNAASHVPDDATYQQSSSVAQGLLSSLAQLDSEKSARLAEQWPSPPAQLSDAARTAYSNFRNTSDRSYLQRLAMEDPDKALSALADFHGGEVYSVRSQLASQMAMSGRRDQALGIVNQGIRQFAGAAPDAQSFGDFAQFVQQISWSAPERFEDAFGLLVSRLSEGAQAREQSFKVQVGDQSVDLTSRESAMLNLFRSMGNHPEMAARALEMVPQLRAKLASVGGMDFYFNSHLWPASRQNSAKDPYRVSRDWAFQLKGKRANVPALLQQKLSELSTVQEQVMTLVGLAQQMSYEDPDVGLQVLQMARSLLPQVEPLEQRVSLLHNLISVYVNFEGEVDADLLSQGFALVEQLRTKDQSDLKEKPPSASSPRTSQAEQLESVLISQWARIDFDAAMRRANLSADDSFRFKTLVAIAQALAF